MTSNMTAPVDLDAVEREARKALRCLYIAVEENIADDVNAKVNAALDALSAELRAARERIAARDAEFRLYYRAFDAANAYIIESPGDPDITRAQAAAWATFKGARDDVVQWVRAQVAAAIITADTPPEPAPFIDHVREVMG